jgi:hypothetical protein
VNGLEPKYFVAPYSSWRDERGHSVVHVVQDFRRALHKKRTHQWQLRSIAVHCGQSKTPMVLHHFAKVQVGVLDMFYFAKVRVAGSNPVVRFKNFEEGFNPALD